MHSKTYTSLLTLTLLSSLSSILAEELREKDVPEACKVMCKPLVELSNTCDVNPEEKDDSGEDSNEKNEADEPIEADCICNNKSFNVKEIGSLCASCLKQNNAFDDDIEAISSQCSFTSVSYAPSATKLAASVTVVATKPPFTPGSDSGAAATKTSGATAASTSSAASGLAPSGPGGFSGIIIGAFAAMVFAGGML